MGVCETSVVVGDVGQKVQTMRCEMSKSWGGMCSMLTVVNPILLVHTGNLSGEYIVSVFTHRTWDFGGNGCVRLWIVINIARCTHMSHGHVVYGICTHTSLTKGVLPLVLPHQTRSLGSHVWPCPRNVHRGADDSNLDPALSTRALSLHF